MVDNEEDWSGKCWKRGRDYILRLSNDLVGGSKWILSVNINEGVLVSVDGAMVKG